MPGKTKDVVQARRGSKLFKSVDAVTGPYDVMALADLPGVKAYGDGMKWIHGVGGVTKTIASLAVGLS